LANIVRLWRSEPTELIQSSLALLDERGLTNGYVDVPGLCKAAKLGEIEVQGWSLNPGRYVGATAREIEIEDFREKLEELQEKFERLTGETRVLENQVTANAAELLMIDA
jgi:type I restriction enzyme M protein